jgi:hypothetical protein
MICSMNAAHPASNPADDRPALDEAAADRAVRMLGDLAEMAMERARVLHAACLAATQAGDFAAVKSLSLACERAERSVRRTLAVELRFARMRQEILDQAEDGAIRRAEAKDTRRREVAGIVTDAIERDPQIGSDTERAERTVDLWERLLEDDDINAALALAKLPIEEIVLRLCRDLGIRPDPAWGIPDPEGEEDRMELAWWPAAGPEPRRYVCYREGRTAPAVWIDLSTKTRLDHPPWELAPDCS